MVFRSVQVPAAAQTANRNPIVDSWKKSHGNATHFLIQLIATVTGGPRVFLDRLDRHPKDVFASRAQPRTISGMFVARPEKFAAVT
jgi:hypothetical protein